jgi:recombination protein RecA
MPKRVAPPPQPDNENTVARSASLDKALGDIAKRYGDGAIMRLGEAHQLIVEAIPPARSR